MLTQILVLLHPKAYDSEAEHVRSRLAAELPQARANVISLSTLADLPRGDIEATEVLVAPTYPEILEVVDASKRLRWIHFLSAGVDPIWQMDFDKSRVLMSKSAGVHAVPMAEYVLGCMLHFGKSLHTFAKQQRDAQWRRFWLDELSGKCVAIIGLGAVGREVARKSKAFDLRVVGTDRVAASVPGVDEVYPHTSLLDVVAQADFVVLTLPLTPQTDGLVDAAVLRCMRPDAVLINVSRGKIVDEEALIAALREGTIAGAALDVFESEPLDARSPLWEMDNVLITPHVAGTTPRYIARAFDVFVENYHQLRREGRLATPVDVQTRY